MTDPTRDFEDRLITWLEAEAPRHEPEGLADRVAAWSAKTRQLPGWVLLERWLPMQTTARFGPASRAIIALATLALLTALTVGAILAAAQDRSSSELPENGLIAFERDADIFVAEPDGSGVQPLVATDRIEWSPLWSPDGTQLAYWSAPPDEWGLWNPDRADTWGQPMALHLVDAEGGAPNIIVEDVDTPLYTSWTDDGSGLIFEAGQMASRVYYAAADGSGARMLGDPDVRAWSPGVTHDRGSIAFLSGNNDEERALTIVDVDGSGSQRLPAEVDGHLIAAGWQPPLGSPDGSAMLVAVEEGKSQTIWVIDLDASGAYRLSEAAEPELAEYSARAVWSPSGDRVAFRRLADGSVHPAVADVATRSVRVLEPTINGTTGVVWSPDGTRLLVELIREENGDPRQLAVIDPDGVEPMVVIDDAGRMDWQPAPAGS